MIGIHRWFGVGCVFLWSIAAAAEPRDPPATIDDLSRALKKKSAAKTSKKPASAFDALEQAVPRVPATPDSAGKKKRRSSTPTLPLPAPSSATAPQAAQAEAMIQVSYQPRALAGPRIVSLRVLLNGKLVAQEKSDRGLHTQGDAALLHAGPLTLGSHKLRVVLVLDEDISLPRGKKKRRSSTQRTIQAEYSFRAAQHKVLAISASLAPTDTQSDSWIVTFQETHLPLNVATQHRVTPHRPAGTRGPAAPRGPASRVR